METKIPYGKTFKSSSELVNLLKSRGLLVYNPELAAKYVENIGYYRLSAYMYPLLLKPKTDHRYKAGASFDQVLMLYRFDKKLRVLIFNEIEKIEIAVHSVLKQTLPFGALKHLQQYKKYAIEEMRGSKIWTSYFPF